jgi:hypothetical protein
MQRSFVSAIAISRTLATARQLRFLALLAGAGGIERAAGCRVTSAAGHFPGRTVERRDVTSCSSLRSHTAPEALFGLQRDARLAGTCGS